MKLKSSLCAISFCGALLMAGCSSNTGLANYNVNQAMNSMPPEVKAKTDDFKFYFGPDSTPKGAEKLGEIKTSLRTNAVGKSPEASCNWVFYSALLKLKHASELAGGNGVGDIESNWQNNPTADKSTFACDNGLWMSGVALKGQAIKVK
ncbi:MAG: excinuclease [Francisellaceae bacterium]